MHMTLQQEHERLLRELSDRGVELSPRSRSTIADQFEQANERFVTDAEGIETLRENTDWLADALVEASDFIAEPGGGGGGGGPEDSYPPQSDGGGVRSLEAESVTAVFTQNCIWPFCDEDDESR